MFSNSVAEVLWSLLDEVHGYLVVQGGSRISKEIKCTKQGVVCLLLDNIHVH